MAITYTVADYTADDSSVEVTYTNDTSLVYKRFVNIPKNSEGAIDQEYFNKVLEDQLRGVENKLTVGAIVFQDPSEVASNEMPEYTESEYVPE